MRTRPPRPASGLTGRSLRGRSTLGRGMPGRFLRASSGDDALQNVEETDPGMPFPSVLACLLGRANFSIGKQSRFLGRMQMVQPVAEWRFGDVQIFQSAHRIYFCGAHGMTTTTSRGRLRARIAKAASTRWGMVKWPIGRRL